jgi:hypothetical protein
MPRLPLLFSLALAAILAACATPPPPPLKLPDMTFTQSAPYRFDVARIEVVNEYKAPAEAPHIEYDMPVAPETAIRNWVRDRLRAVGSKGILRVVIRNASATETPLATEKGIKGMFTKGQAANVDLNLDVAIQMLDERQFVIAEVAGRASRSRTEPEGQKLNERDRLLWDLTFDLVKGFNDGVASDIPNTFGRWLGTR